MALTNEGMARGPVKTYEDLRATIADSGRAYDEEKIQRAYALAERAHKGQLRLSGESYISHPLAVACLVVDLGLDTDSVEDTDTTLDDVKAQFGADVALLVDGVTKLGRIKFSSVEEQQAENLRKMLMAMSHDVRVMLIKLCDRLHNMRTGDSWPEQKRRDKALETMEVYAPIAHRLGMANVKEELEDRSLQYLDPVGYDEIRAYLAKNGAAEDFIANIADKIKERLAENGMAGCTIKKRVKSVYGIYRKMYIQNRTFAEIYDVYAVRIILDTVAECYNALGVIHDMYHPIPSRFKDYISTPKPNMYQSLHTTVIGHEGIPFEVQIRTWEMDQTAEYGVAAHWKYKAGLGGKAEKLDDRVAWVRQLLESQRDSDDAGDLLREIKSELLPEEVFAFTPKGDVINLPAGATAIDFAYAIHSAVGNRMVGAKVDGRIVPIDHKVNTGEIIEVLTGPQDKGPSRDWLNIVVTSEARNKIRNWFKKERKEENIAEGRAALERELRRNLITIPAEEYDAFMTDMARRMRLNTPEELYAAIGYGGISSLKVIGRIREDIQRILHQHQVERQAEVPVEGHPEVTRPAVPKRTHSEKGIIVEGLSNCLVKFSKCCTPVPGDDIVGFITKGYGVSVHRRDCPNADPARRSPNEKGRWIKVSWADDVEGTFRTTLQVVAKDRINLIMDISTVLSSTKTHVGSLNARSTPDGFALITLDTDISSSDQLKTVMRRIEQISGVMRVTRPAG